MTARRKPTAPAVAAETAATSPPSFTTAHSFAGDFHINIAVSVNIPQLADLLPYLGGGVNTETLNRLESEMAKSFKKLMEEVRSATQEIKDHKTAADAAEVQEDADAKTRDDANAAKIAEAEAKIAELQAKLDAGTLSDEQSAEAEAAIVELRAAAGLPEPTEEPAPTPEPTPEPAPEPTPDDTELPVTEVDPNAPPTP